MFRAVDMEGRSYVAANYETAAPAEVPALRRRCRRDELECPLCKAPVFIRAGEILTWHFAHKSQANCPYQNEDAARQRGRLLLFRWLNAKLPEGAVSLEAELPGVELPRPLDVLVDTEEVKAGYWYFHKSIREPEVRDTYWSVVEGARAPGGKPVHIVHDSKSAKVVDPERNLLRLSTTHKESRERTDFDVLHGRRGGSLHLLDLELEHLLTYRAVRYDHGTSYEYGAKLETPLAEMLLRPPSGELVHPGEYEQWQAREEKAAAEQPRQGDSWRQREANMPAWRKQDDQRHRLRRVAARKVRGSNRPIVPPKAPKPPRPCKRCGKMTPEDEWMVYDATTCSLCRKCSRQS